MHNTLVSWSMLWLTQVDAATGPVASDAVKVQSVWDFIIKGGPMMIPIGICSLVALTVIVERLASLRRRNVIPPGFVPGLIEILDGEGESAAASAYCQSDGSPIARICGAAIKRMGESLELIERQIRDEGERVVLTLRKNLRSLSVIASIAPLLGLLGTIFGMIDAFQTVATSGEALGRTELLAKGIYQAMITTAAGLLVAIPVLVAYHWLSSIIERLVADMDRITVDFIEDHVIAPKFPVGPGPKLRATDDEEEEAEEENEEAVIAAAGA